MPRPRKRRRLLREPKPAIYKPAGIPLHDLRQVVLIPEELEALRLADLEGLSQEESAIQMCISRSTFQRILDRAHRQVALALVEGQALCIESNETDVTFSL
jgi:predicted DNA-binding protein (UPF0251 family)